MYPPIPWMDRSSLQCEGDVSDDYPWPTRVYADPRDRRPVVVVVVVVVIVVVIVIVIVIVIVVIVIVLCGPVVA